MEILILNIMCEPHPTLDSRPIVRKKDYFWTHLSGAVALKEPLSFTDGMIDGVELTDFEFTPELSDISSDQFSFILFDRETHECLHMPDQPVTEIIILEIPKLSAKSKEEQRSLCDAIQYAIEKHKGQKRKFSGEPYVCHPIRVMSDLAKFQFPIPVLIAGVLHDTIEDTDATEEEIAKLFGNEVASIVKEVTNDKAKLKEMGKTAYLAEKVANLSRSALAVKFADRKDNLSDIGSNEWSKNYLDQSEQVFGYFIIHPSDPELLALYETLLEKIYQ